MYCFAQKAFAKAVAQERLFRKPTVNLIWNRTTPRVLLTMVRITRLV
jgi:hypothetical protein